MNSFFSRIKAKLDDKKRNGRRSGEGAHPDYVSIHWRDLEDLLREYERMDDILRKQYAADMALLHGTPSNGPEFKGLHTLVGETNAKTE